jgi:hypothetical protein
MGMLSYLSETPDRLAHATALIGVTDLDQKQFLISLGISPYDTVSLDAETEGGIEHVRRFSSDLLLSPQFGSIRLGVIKSVELLSQPAQNALLKLLEEPPPKVKMILFITMEQDVLPTILSRCRRYYVSSETKKEAHGVEARLPLDRFIDAEDQAKNNREIALVEGSLASSYKAWRQAGFPWADYPRIETLFQSYLRLRRGVNPRLILESLVLSSDLEPNQLPVGKNA